MTTVFREIQSNYWLVLFATDENRESHKEGNSDMPLSVAEMLKTLTNSNDCRFIYRKHINGENSNGELNDYCQSMPSNHSHIRFYLPQFSGAEKLIEQSVCFSNLIQCTKYQSQNTNCLLPRKLYQNGNLNFPR